MGIDADFLPHLFNRFTQEDRGQTRAHGGLGLGLAIVRYLVEAHGGSVHADSAGKGMGATFTVLLPLMKASEIRRYSNGGGAPAPGDHRQHQGRPHSGGGRRSGNARDAHRDVEPERRRRADGRVCRGGDGPLRRVRAGAAGLRHRHARRGWLQLDRSDPLPWVEIAAATSLPSRSPRSPQPKTAGMRWRRGSTGTSPNRSTSTGCSRPSPGCCSQRWRPAAPIVSRPSYSPIPS